MTRKACINRHLKKKTLMNKSKENGKQKSTVLFLKIFFNVQDKSVFNNSIKYFFKNDTYTKNIFLLIIKL